MSGNIHSAQEKLFEQLSQLLGRLLDAKNLEVLGSELDDMPDQLDADEHTIYSFKKSGFSIHCDHSVVGHIFFQFSGARVRSGEFKKYSGNLPCGIEVGDHKLVVQKKVGKRPFDSHYEPSGVPDSTKALVEKYRLGAYIVTMTFHGPNEKLGSMELYPK